MKTINTFYSNTSLCLETSFATYNHMQDVKVKFTIGIIDDERGYFELSDVETGGEKWYADGGLWFDGKKLIDYDGVFELPEQIIDELENMSYDVLDFKK